MPRLLRGLHRAFFTATATLVTVYAALTFTNPSDRRLAEHVQLAMEQAGASRVAGDKATLSWNDLLRHAGRMQHKAGTGAGEDPATRMNSKLVRMAGYMVPLDAGYQRTTDFLLVPYYGACIHVPPPPPYQMVHVMVDGEGVPLDFQQPVWVEGKFRVERSESEYGESAYAMSAQRVWSYEN